MNLNNLNLNEKIEDLLAALKKKEDEKEKNTVLWVLAIIGAVAAVAGIAFAVYRFFAPDYLEDFEEDFDDDFAGGRPPLGVRKRHPGFPGGGA